MTIYLFHGDNTRDSRNAFTDALSKERERGVEVRHLAGDKLAAKDLESTLATENLFSSESVAIEGLLSRIKSKEKDRCLGILNGYTGAKNIFLWEGKLIPKTGVPHEAKVSLSKAPSLLFTFLDTLIPANTNRALTLLHELEPTTNDLLVFTLAARTVANLLLAKSGKSVKLAPWQLAKLRGQAGKWDEAKLLDFHDKLLAIDFAAKTGTTKLSYYDHLDILLLDVLG